MYSTISVVKYLFSPETGYIAYPDFLYYICKFTDFSGYCLYCKSIPTHPT